MSDEEKLAREAIAQIREWVEKGSRSGRNSLPRLAIKFCGGCNPIVERGQIARLIQDELADLVRWVSTEEEVNLLLIISGCRTACADRAEVKEKAAHYLAIAGPAISIIQK